MSASPDAIDAQLNVPGYVWKLMKSDSPVPNNAISQNGKLDGDEVYIARVRDGQCIYIGTAVPKKGACFYLDKNNSLKTSSSYEILTVEYFHDVMFLDMDTDNLKLEELFDRSNLLPAGTNEKGEVLYVARHVQGENTYYGWLDKASKSAYFPKNAKLGQQVLNKFIGALTFFDVPQYCICPTAPTTE